MQQGYSLPYINGWTMFLGGVASLATAMAWEHGRVIMVSNLSGMLWWGFLLIITANVVHYNLYGYLLRHYSITLLTFAGFLSPLFGILYAMGVTGEQCGWQHLGGAVLITIGLFLFYRAELLKKKFVLPQVRSE